MKAKNNLSIKYIKSRLDYDPKTGLLIWKPFKGLRLRVGKVAGTINKKGYVVIVLKGRPWQGHRLAWVIVKGRWPKDEIDHKNLIGSDNRFRNLREATSGQNKRNV